MKSLAKNSLYNILYKCSNLIFPLIVSVHVSRILFADGVGKVSSAQNIATYFTLLAALGLPTYGTKIIAACGDDKEARSIAFSELFFFNLISTLICSVVYYVVIFNIPYFINRLNLSIVCGISIVFNVINVDWYYQGREEYRYIMQRNFVIKVISLAGILIFVNSIDDYVIYAAILNLSKVANNIFNIIHLRKDVNFTYRNLIISKHIKSVFIFFAASIAIEIYTLADTTMLTFIHGDDVVGYYTTARKGIDVIRTMIIAVCSVYLPRLSYYYTNNRKNLFLELVNRAVKILIYISVPATVGVYLTAESFVPLLFGKSFVPSVVTTQILSLSIVTVAFSNFFGYQVLTTIGKEHHMLYSTIIGAIINIMLNLMLVFRFKHNGVAIASAITELCVAIYQFAVVKKFVKLYISEKFVLSVLLSTGIMCVGVSIVKKIISQSIAVLCMSVIVGVFIYLLMTYVMGNEITYQIISKGKLLKKKDSCLDVSK